MRLSAEAAWSFRSSAAECARRCLDCERCRYISFSVGFRDCSWYALRPKAVQCGAPLDSPRERPIRHACRFHACDLEALNQPANHFTARVTASWLMGA